jgi:hypothetical protein
MSHYAKIVDGIVTEVIVADKDHIDTLDGEWVQTSYNTFGGEHPENRPLRKNYASIGYTYDRSRDAFIAPKPYPSWVLDEQTCLWVAPITKPDQIVGKYHGWNETIGNWEEVSA